MTNFIKFKNFMKNIILGKTARFLAIFLIVVLVVESLSVWRVFELAKNHLQANDPRKLQNRSETTFYFAPLSVRQNSSLKREEIVEYLNGIAYRNSGDNTPASYLINENFLKINSRLPLLFPDVTLYFEKNRVAKIVVNGQELNRVELEPVPLQNVIDFVDDSFKKDLRIRRVVLQPSSIPQLVIEALLSTEDKTFYENRGVDWLAVSIRPVLSLGEQGGSSISQGLIKNNVIEGAKNEFWQTGYEAFDRKYAKFERKIAEIPMALEANRMMSKDEILAAYLSMNYMGTVGGVDLQGFAVASQEFFDTRLFDLSDATDPKDVAFAATLAGMNQGAGSYLKYVRNGEKCDVGEPYCLDLLKRRNAVLDLMRLNLPAKYTTELVNRAKAEPLGFVFASNKRLERPIEADSRNFTKYATLKTNLPSELEALKGEEGEVRVITSLDIQLQRAAVEAVRNNLSKIQKEVDRAYKQQRERDEDSFATVENKCRQKYSSNHDNCKDLFKAQAALVAVDASTGEILAMTNGLDINSKRSPGSLVKPFFYLKALENGTFKGQPFTAATLIGRNSDKALLQDYCTEDENLGGSGTARRQLAMSWNIGACVAAQSANLPTDFVGLVTGSNPEHKLLASIGGTAGSEARLLDMVQAYTIFPNNGKMRKLTAYKTVYQTAEGANKKVEFSSTLPTSNTDPAATYITTEMMKSVVTSGTASNFRTLANLDSPVAGKSGSGMVADLWWVNFTPRVVVGVLVYMPHNLPELRREDGFTGSKTSAPIAAEFMRAVAKFRPYLLEGEFTQPQNIIKRKIDSEKGCLVNSDGVEEYFIVGREPNLCK